MDNDVQLQHLNHSSYHTYTFYTNFYIDLKKKNMDIQMHQQPMHDICWYF